MLCQDSLFVNCEHKKTRVLRQLGANETLGLRRDNENIIFIDF